MPHLRKFLKLKNGRVQGTVWNIVAILRGANLRIGIVVFINLGSLIVIVLSLKRVLESSLVNFMRETLFFRLSFEQLQKICRILTLFDELFVALHHCIGVSEQNLDSFDHIHHQNFNCYRQRNKMCQDTLETSVYELAEIEAYSVHMSKNRSLSSYCGGQITLHKGA